MNTEPKRKCTGPHPDPLDDTPPESFTNSSAVIRQLNEQITALCEKLTELKGWETTEKLLHEEECKSLRADNERLKAELAEAQKDKDLLTAELQMFGDRGVRAELPGLREQLAAAKAEASEWSSKYCVCAEVRDEWEGKAFDEQKAKNQATAREAVMLGALELVAHSDDLNIIGEDDGPELARRLRLCINTASYALAKLAASCGDGKDGA